MTEDLLQPGVAVVVPAYNVEDYITDALESLMQDPVRAVVVADDGSTDATCDRVRGFLLDQDSDRRVNLLRCSGHHNQYRAKNTAFPPFALPYQYIGFLDADDIATPDRFARQVAALQADPDLIAVGGMCRNIDEAGNPIGDEIAWPLDEDPLIKGQRQFGIGLWNATALYRNEVFRWLGSFDYTSAMGDTEWFMRLVFAALLRGKKLRNLKDGPVIHRRIRRQQVSVEGHNRSLDIERTAYERLLKARFDYYRAMYLSDQLRMEHLHRANEGNPRTL